MALLKKKANNVLKGDGSLGAGKEPRIVSLARTVIPPLLTLCIFLIAWQLIVVLSGIPSFILPGPAGIWEVAVENRMDLLASVTATLRPIAIGYISSVVVGITVGMIMALSKALERSIYPYAVLLQSIPVVALAPLIVVWFGPGLTAISLVAFILALFPMISNTVLGLTSTDHGLLNLMRLYNASGWQTMWKLRFPAALPYILGGMKISAGLSVIGAIVGEFVAGVGGGSGGLGYAIIASSLNLKIPYLFANALAAGLLGIIVFLLATLLSKALLGGWHESSTKQEN